MDKGSISAEWVVCESDAAWNAAQRPEVVYTLESARAPRIRARRIWATAAVALLVLAITGVWVWRTAQTGLDRIDAELNDAVAQELSAIGQGKTELAVNLTTGSSDVALREQLQQEYALLLETAPEPAPEDEMAADLEIVRLEKDMAAVRVLIESGEETFRQTRFYRRTSEGWLQTPAEPALLGERRRWETEYFSIGYFELDEKIVAEAVPRLDALVAQMRADFGLPAIVEEERLVIELTSDRYYTGRRVRTEERSGRVVIEVTSPSLLLLPAAVSESDSIVQSVTLLLVFVYPLIEEAIYLRDKEWRGTARRWLPLRFAFRLWEFWESDAPLAVWKEDIVGWMYNYPDRVPVRYDEICRMFHVWQFSPISMSIPLLCESATHELDAALPMSRSLRGLLTPAVYCCEAKKDPDLQSQAVALATVLDYAVATYGRERLPVLVGALGEHESWETLIPAVFGVSVAEFEAGWQEYMKTMYGSR